MYILYYLNRTSRRAADLTSLMESSLHRIRIVILNPSRLNVTHETNV